MASSAREVVMLPCRLSCWWWRVWTLGSDQICWIFAHLALCSSNPLCPQSSQNRSVLQHHLLEKSTGSLRYGCENTGFSELGLLSVGEGGSLPSSSASRSGRFVVIKILGLKVLAYVLTLGVLFTALLFLSLMSECCIFVAISTGMCCARTDVAALPDLKRWRLDSVLTSFE